MLGQFCAGAREEEAGDWNTLRGNYLMLLCLLVNKDSIINVEMRKSN